jgi:integrase
MKPEPRERVLSRSEVATIWRVLEADREDVYSAVFRLLLLTGQRRGEVATMKWSDVDFERREWHQPTNKSDRPHTIALSDEALAVIAEQKRIKPEIFTNRRAGTLGGPRGTWSYSLLKLQAASGISGFTIHDLRRTAATLMASLRVDKGVIEMLLNHSEGAGRGSVVASIYNRHSYAVEKREALDKLAGLIRELATSGPGSIVAFPAAQQGYGK